MSDVTSGWDFLHWLGHDLAASVFGLLDHPSDLVRAAAVSHSWRRCVVESGMCKSLCLKMCPEAAVFTSAVEVSGPPPPPPAAAESSGDAALATSSLESQFRIYSNLCGALVHFTKPDANCILHCVCASSTDDAAEMMEHTLEPQDRNNHRPSFWSSQGQDDPAVPEALTYRLTSDICVISEIKLQPFQAFFQDGSPIYSPEMVRFRFGHCKLPRGTEPFDIEWFENQIVIADENFVWTYTSPKFPVLQENMLQSFVLPRPVLCIGGVVKIELLGRVQKCAADDKYYICVCYAQVIGRSLSPVFMVDIPDSGSDVVLKYLPGVSNLCSEDVKQADDSLDSFDMLPSPNSEWHKLVARFRKMRHSALMDVNLLDDDMHPIQLMEEDDAGVV